MIDLHKKIIGERFVLEGVLVEVRRSSNGCNYCFRQNSEEGAQLCQYAYGCFAHMRPDKNSVIFKKIEE